MSALKTVDELDVKSREFYERARFKLALSLILAAVGMMLLGFGSAAGAEARVDLLLAGSTGKGIPQFYLDMMQSEGGSQGFACFAYIVGFFLSIGMALYVSPLLGSENEKRMLSNPSNISFEAQDAAAVAETGGAKAE